MSAREMMSEAVRDRVDRVQARIAAAGIKDMKFSRHPERWNAASYDERATEICDLLEAVLDGNTKPLPLIGDSHIGGQCICPACGLRHGLSARDGGF
jgi:hypothetical protein